jgi:hypothetical protein
MGGGGGKTKKVNEKHQAVQTLDESIDYGSEMLEYAGEDLDKTLEEKRNFDSILARADEYRNKEYANWAGEIPESTEESKLDDNERDRMLNYLDEYANHWAYVDRVGTPSEGDEPEATMTEDQLKSYLHKAYGHSKEFGDEVKHIISNSGRFKWDRQYDHVKGRVDEELQIVKTLYDGQYAAYQQGVEDYKAGMTDLAKQRHGIAAIESDEARKQAEMEKWGGYGRSYSSSQDAYRAAIFGGDKVVPIVRQGTGFGNRSSFSWVVVPQDEYNAWAEDYESNFVGNLDQSAFDNMTLDQLEAFTVGDYTSKKNFLDFQQSEQWDRNIKDYTEYSWD